MLNEQNMKDKRNCEASYHGGMRCLSWSAVLAGAFVSVGLGFLVNLFFMAISLSAFTATAEGNTVLATGGFIALIIATFVSMFLGGYVAGYLSRPYCGNRNLGELYGFVSWCLALILSLFIAADAGALISRYNYLVDPNTTISFTVKESAPLVSQKQKPRQTTAITVNTEKAANTIGVASFVLFFIFFIGALASAFGGYCGVACRRKE